jgi:signal transduction histidine kinase/Tfp pilus assembly protein PilF
MGFNSLVKFKMRNRKIFKNSFLICFYTLLLFALESNLTKASVISSLKQTPVQDSLTQRLEAGLIPQINEFIAKNKFVAAGKLLDSLREHYYKFYYYPKAISTAKITLKYEKQIGDNKLVASAYNTLGLTYWKTGDLDSALYFLNKGLALRKFIDDPVDLGRSYNNIGLVYWRKGDIENSYSFYLKALKVRQECGDNYGIVTTVNNIGLIYQRMRYYELAEESIKHALHLSDSINYEAGRVYSLRRLASLFIAQHRYDDAAKYYDEIVTSYKKRNEKSGLAQIYNDFGLIQEKKGNLKAARDFFKQSLDRAREIDDKFIESFALLNLGRIDRLARDEKEGLLNLTKAKELAETGKFSTILRDAYLELSKLLEATGETEEALFYLNKHVSLKDSLLNETVLSSVGEMRIRYEIEKSEETQKHLQTEVESQNKINLSLTIFSVLILIGIIGLVSLFLRQKKLGKLLELNNQEMEKVNVQLQRSNDELVMANETKNKLFAIIAHDLKSPFVSVLGFAEIIKEEADAISNRPLSEFSDKILSASYKLVDLVNNLTGWALVQRNLIKVNAIDFELSEVCGKVIKEASLNLELKDISTTTSLEVPSLIHADPEMISVIVRNLIANAIKFTNKGGNINLTGLIVGDKYQLTVTDDGVGMTEEQTESVLTGRGTVSTYGTSNEKGTGLGLSVSRDFILQNKGDLKISSIPGKGTSFILELPRA